MIDTETRKAVIKRAKNRCEYCHLKQKWFDLNFHIEHIIAQQHRKDDRSENLALACDKCNSFKGPNLATFDPESGEQVNLFHPRIDKWDEHFAIVGIEVLGLTSTGRGTVSLLKMNSEKRLAIRQGLRDLDLL